MRTFTSLQIITPMLLGDGYSYGKREKCLEFCHHPRYEDYAMWKKALLQRYVHPNTSSGIRKHTAGGYSGQSKTQVWVRTPAHHRITSAYKRMYLDGRKQISKDILSKLTDLGLAIWFMDDGNVLWKKRTKSGNPARAPRIRQVQLNTHSFSREENEMIAEYLADVYELQFRVYEDKRNGKWFLRMGQKDQVERFLSIVSPYVMQVPSMRYKVGC